MAFQASKSVASFLLILNLLMYAVVAMIAGCALDYGINETPHEAKQLTDLYTAKQLLPVRLFPIYYPSGNMATGFFVIFSLVAGTVGVATSLTGLHDVYSGSRASLLSAAASSFVAWGLTLLAMVLALKQISIDERSVSLMDALTIILSSIQLRCAGAIYLRASSTSH